MAPSDKPEHCLVCGNAGRLRRGLCNAHYQSFQRELRRVPPEHRAAYEKELITSKLLKPPKPRGYKAKVTQFSLIAEKYKTYGPDKRIKNDQ